MPREVHRLWLVVCHQLLTAAKPGRRQVIQSRLSLYVLCIINLRDLMKRGIEVGDT